MKLHIHFIFSELDNEHWEVVFNQLLHREYREVELEWSKVLELYDIYVKINAENVDNNLWESYNRIDIEFKSGSFTILDDNSACGQMKWLLI